MNSFTIKVIAFFVSSFIIITVIAQIYFKLTDNQRTEEALLYTVSETISFEGVFVRNEKTIDFNGNGVLNYTNPDGSKIAKNSKIAEVYSDESQIQTLKSISELENEKEVLERIVNQGTIKVAQPEFISNQIDENYLLIENHIRDKDFEKINQTNEELTVLMNIYNIITGNEDKYTIEQRITDIDNEIVSLNRKLVQPISTITTENSGYFVSKIDGYEDVLNFDTINDLSATDIENIINSDNKVDFTSVGKIIDGYSWKMVGIVNTSNKFIENTQVDLKFSGISELIPVNVDSMVKIDDDNNYKIILSCDWLNYNLVQNRTENVDIVFNQYTGIRIPRSAINFDENGTRGVYIILGNSIIFKKIDVIYEGKDFILSKNNADFDYVHLYDKIVFEEEKKIERTSK